MLKRYEKIGLAIAACTLLSTGTSSAVVILTFTQAGPDVTATWSGTYDVPVGTGDFLSDNADTSLFRNSTNSRGGTQFIVAGYGAGPAFGYLNNSGIYDSTLIAFGFAIGGSYTGQTFGFLNGSDRRPFPGTSLVIPLTETGSTTPGLYSPVGTMTFASTTLAAMGAANYDNTLAFTGTDSVAGSREIRFTTVPEPTTGLLSLLAVGGLTLRRRRRA